MIMLLKSAYHVPRAKFLINPEKNAQSVQRVRIVTAWCAETAQKVDMATMYREKNRVIIAAQATSATRPDSAIGISASSAHGGGLARARGW